MGNLIEKENLKGSQMGIGHISEHSAVSRLIRHYKLSDDHHQNLLRTTEENLKHHKANHSSQDDAEDRDEHGNHITKAIIEHIHSFYPGHSVSEVHHTNYGSISDVTNGKHKDSRQDNPSDIVVGMKHPKTGETVYHGYSLKSTQKKGGHIGFKNPTPKTMDRELGTRRGEMHKEAMEEFFEAHPHLRSMPNKSKTKRSRKDEIVENDAVRESAKNISKKHFHAIAEHTSKHLGEMLKVPEGHDRLKHFLKRHYMNSTSSMPYSKVTGSGTKKTGYAAQIEDTQNNHVSRLLSDPHSKMRVKHSGSIIKYEIHDPITKKWHGVANEQVKTSSGFGYSSGRHNIHPPSVNIENDPD